MMRRAWWLLALFACEAAPRGTLEIAAPSRIRQAITADRALCAKVSAELTFDRTDDIDAPPIDRVALGPTEADPCVYALDTERNLRAGTYDLVVVFRTTESVATCTDPTLVGAYVRRGIAFPFTAEFTGLTEADFVSRPGDEARLGEGDFDLDDDGRDNLAELTQGSNPCKPSSVPVASIEAPSTSSEGATIEWVVVSSDEDGVPHRATFSLRQPRGPSAGTETITVRLWTDGRAAPELTRPAAGELWRIEVGADEDPAPGAGRWKIDLFADEPFVGQLSAGVSTDDGSGNTLSTGQAASTAVAGKDDPTELFFATDTGETKTRALRFQEQGATKHRFRFSDPDRDSDFGTWVARLESSTVGVTLRRDAGFWELAFSPTNHQALEAPPSGYPATIAFVEPGGAVVSTATITLEVSPLENDPPSFEAPTLGELGLPSTPFQTHRIHFAIHDPDRVATAPSCSVSIATLSCPTPFQTVRCEPTGPREGDRWPFQVILEPIPDYFASCGASPAMKLRLEIADVAPVGAVDGAELIATNDCDAGGAEPCDWSLRTAAVVDPAAASGGPAAPASFRGSTAAIVHAGAENVALVQVLDDNFESASYLVDLTYPSPTWIHKFTIAELCELKIERPGRFGVADPVNHRFAVHGTPNDGSGCSFNDSGLFTIDIATKGVRYYSRNTICGEPWNDRLGNPMVDPKGDVWLPCATTTPRLVRLDAQGNLTPKTIAGQDGEMTEENQLVTDPSGKSHFVWFDDKGILVVDLSTFDGTPKTTRFTMASDWWQGQVEDAIVDDARHAVLVAFHPNQANAELWRVNVGTGTPVLEGPLDLGDIGGNPNNGESKMSLVLRDTRGLAADPDVDLVVSGGSGSDPKPQVDLDGFQVVSVRPVDDYFLGSGSPGIFASPDRRFYFAPTYLNYEDTGAGVYLYRYDPAEPRQFISMPAPKGLLATWSVTVSREAKLAVVADEGQLTVLYFLDAIAGRD